MRLGKRFRDMRTIRTLLEGAEAEAGRAGESVPGAEHLLLAALDLPDGTARRAFERVGADPSALRQAIEEQHVEALRAVGIHADAGAEGAVSIARHTKGVYRSSGSAQSAFQAAGKLARETRSQLVGAHVVLAIAGMEHGTAIRAVRSLGIDIDALAAAARDEVGERRGGRATGTR
jgi:ATP-dependent Clp protease ATP-binding subunit ClpA